MTGGSRAGRIPAVAAVDVGGTTIKAAAVTGGGAVTGRVTVPTPFAEGPDAVVRAVREVVREVVGAASNDLQVLGVGAVVPGFVDADAGVARFAANIGWHDVPLRSMLQQDTDLPVVLEHDVRSAGIAEEMLGRIRGTRDSLVAVLGTGIAAVIRSGAQRVVGATRLAGELGHVPVWPDGDACPCGQRGCLERYASAAAVARRYTALTGRSAGPAEIVAAVPSDRDAAAVWSDAVTALGIALASCVMLLDPEIIVLSGGLSGAGAALVDPLRAVLARRVVCRDPPPVEISPLGADAGLLGAAILAAGAAGRPDLVAPTVTA